MASGPWRCAREKTGRMPRIDPIFGVSFGEEFRCGMAPEQNGDMAWACTFTPDGPFMGCSEFRAFATPITRRVFMARAVFVGNSAAEAQAEFNEIRRLLQRATGGEFIDLEADGNDRVCRMLLGGATFVLLTKKGGGVDMVLLDFMDLGNR